MVGDLESGKDLLQELLESTASHIGHVAVIITNAVQEVARELGDLATDGFEMMEARRRARADHQG